jgi:TolB-like protein
LDFLAELRRRSVFRVAAAYLISGWVVMQVVSLIAATAAMPHWASPLVLMFIIAGFPIALIVAWAFELTPEGPKRTEDSGKGESIKPFRPADAILLAGLAIVIGAIIWQQVSNPVQVQNPADERITGQSIAVLPFVAISEAPEDVVLGDGLAEELLNVLAQLPDLAVAGRTSSFAFREGSNDIREIGEALGVSHVLEGSVRRAGEQLRVTAQLIRSSDGFHVWSGTYDRPFADVLVVQDDIVRQIAQVLTVRLGVSKAIGDASETAIPAAYEQYLQGRYYFAERQVAENRTAAITAFQTAVDIDPSFADGWAALARALVYSPYSLASVEEAYRRGHQAAQNALELDPNSAEALTVLSHYSLRLSRDWEASQRYVEQALALAPNAAYVHYQSAMHFEYLGDRERASAAFRRALALDPLNLTIRQNAIEAFGRMELYHEAHGLAGAPGVAANYRLELRRAQAFWDGDADELEAVYRDWLEIQSQEASNDPFLALSDNFYRISVAELRDDEDTLAELVPAVVDYLSNSDTVWSVGLISYTYFLARDYRNSAEWLARWTNNGELDLAVYLDWSHLPHEYRCQPAYNEVWQRPGIPELLEIRRANGATGNLPLSGPECAEWLEDGE